MYLINNTLLSTRIILLLLACCGASLASAQQLKYTLSGYIKDSSNGESLTGATIAIKSLGTGTATNTYGFFSLTVPEGQYEIVVSYIGFANDTLHVNLKQNTRINISMKPSSMVTKEVVITADRTDQNVKSTKMSVMEMTAERVKSLPVIFGEPDVLKAITLLPGIKSGGEGSTGFYVRGGGPDQNLVLMDEAVIYNPSHLLGFLSVFNTDAVKNLEIIKGGMPANYGGRLSSILNVSMREGNNQKYEVNGGVGLIASRLSVEGPIKKGKSSFMVAGRRTYIDALVKPFLTTEQKANGYYFYDVNLKANFVLSDKDRLYVSGYFGRDIFNFRSPTNNEVRFQVSWGNAAASVRWNHIFSDRLFSNTTVIYNRYDLANTFEFGTNGFDLSSGLADVSAKTDFTWFVSPSHQAKFGAIYTYHTFTPGIATGQVGTIKIDEEINKQYAHEAAVYALDEWKVNNRIILNGGLRFVMFNQVGPYTEQLFDDQNLPTGEGKSYKGGQSIQFYPGIEPRFAATYLINSESSVKASFTQTYQFIHLATTSGAQFPADLWVPSSQRVKPQLAYQYVIGYFRNFKNNEYESSVELYYKPMYNQIEFKPGAQLFFNQNLENEMIFGQGLSYGAEFFIKKKFGRLNGWIGYTWSRTTRQFDELNDGKAYYFRYDRTHDISVVVTYQISKKWSGNVVFVYGTGNATTLPTGRITYKPGYDTDKRIPVVDFIDVYDKINAYRLPAYHRMDVSFVYQHKKTERWESSWNFSVYNVYNRANPYFIYFVPDVEAQKVKAYMVYLFPILPSVAWNFKF